MIDARNFAYERIPADVSPDARRIAEEAVFNALYGVMMILDGVTSNPLDPEPTEHRAQYVLLSQICDFAGNVLETFELAPDGDPLCMGIHMWMEGEFGSYLPHRGMPQTQDDTSPGDSAE